jgi:hypothetical protein
MNRLSPSGRSKSAALLLLLLPLLTLQGQQPQLELATIEGTVIDSVTGQPLAGVLVTSRLPVPALPPSDRAPQALSGRTFVPSVGGQDPLGRSVVQVLTDAKGQFSVSAGVGKSNVVFGKDNYGVRTLSYTVASGQKLQAPLVRLMPTGVIAGRVFDSTNTPLASVSVTPFLFNSKSSGMTFSRYLATKTDDRGEFRLIGLPANAYILLISSSNSSAFYPGVSEFSRTEHVALESGKEIRLKDVVLSGPTKKGTIRVTLTNGPGEGPKDVNYSFANGTATVMPAGVDGVSLYQVQGISSRDPVIHLDAGQSYSSSHGVSSIGSYRVDVRWKDVAGSDVRSIVYADFTGDDIDLNVVLKTPDGKLSCRAVLDGPDGTSTPMADVRVVLDGGSNPSVCVTQQGGGGVVPSIKAGKYTFGGFQGIPQGLYVASAKQGDRDVLTDGLEVTKEATTIEIRVRRGAGVARGVVTDSQGRIVHGAVVIAVPDLPFAGRVAVEGLYPLDRTDQNGAFEIRGLRPGGYRLLAWSDVQDSALNNPEFFKKFEGKEAAITIAESQTASKDLKILDEKN